MKPKGFVALMSVIVISAVLLTVVAGDTLGFWYARAGTAEWEYKARSEALADACIAHTLSQLAQNQAYAGPEIVPVGDDSCSILDASAFQDSGRTFSIQAVYQHVYTNLLVTIDTATLQILFRREIAHL